MDSLVFFLGLDWTWQSVREESINISQPDENHSKYVQLQALRIRNVKSHRKTRRKKRHLIP